MIGVDTNVLVRILVEDDPRQLKRASQMVSDAAEKSESIFVSDVVLAELDWVLDGVYGVSRQHITKALQGLLASERFEFEDRSRVVEALELYHVGTAELSDYLIGCAGTQRGARTTVTFDRTLRDDERFTLL